MKTMKVKLLVSRSGEDGSFSAGDIIDVSEREAVALIRNGSAEPKDKKAYEKAIADEEDAIKIAAEKEAEITAIIKNDTLVSELRGLYAQVALKAAQIEGVVLTDEEVEAFVEKSMNGEDPDESNQGNLDEQQKDENDSNAPDKGEGKE